MVEGGGFEPPKAVPADLQSALVDRLSTPPVPYFLTFLGTFAFKTRRESCQVEKQIATTFFVYHQMT